MRKNGTFIRGISRIETRNYLYRAKCELSAGMEDALDRKSDFRKEGGIVKHVTSTNSDRNNIGNIASQEGDWTSSLADLSPSGSNYAVSHQAIELFTALRSGNPRNAVVGASQLAEMTADRGLRTTYEAAKALEVALLCSDRCDAATVKSTCAELVAEMLRLRLVNNIPMRRKEGE